MRRRVNEVGEGDEGGGETDDGAVERGDEDLGMRVEGVGDVEVAGDEVLEPVLARGVSACAGRADGDVGATGLY